MRISVNDVYDLGQEFFRWEIATAVAGSVLGINAFNQPDVEASKLATRALTEQYEKTGTLTTASSLERCPLITHPSVVAPGGVGHGSEVPSPGPHRGGVPPIAASCE